MERSPLRTQDNILLVCIGGSFKALMHKAFGNYMTFS